MVAENIHLGELPRKRFRLRDPSAGRIPLDGKETRTASPAEAIAPGIPPVPEDRKVQGLVIGMNCRDNMTLPQVDDLEAGPFAAERSAASTGSPDRGSTT